MLRQPIKPYPEGQYVHTYLQVTSKKKKVPLAGYTQEVGRTLKTPERNTDSKRHESAGSIPEYFSISAFSPSGY